jgi:hypothetical protein
MGLVISNGLERYKVFLLAESPVISHQFPACLLLSLATLYGCAAVNLRFVLAARPL